MASLRSWQVIGDRVLLCWSDGSEFYVSKPDFNRLFGPIVSGDKDQIKKEFGLF